MWFLKDMWIEDAWKWGVDNDSGSQLPCLPLIFYRSSLVKGTSGTVSDKL